MRIRDDRTKAEKVSHTWLVIGTDTFLSGWGKAKDGASYAVWACLPSNRQKVLAWVESRSDMKRVRESSEAYGFKYHPSATGDCHIYVVNEGHPALA
jgi:hypothetical protein